MSALILPPAFERICTGDLVQVCAADDFYAYIDGWRGRVAGWHGSLAEVNVPKMDHELGHSVNKVFFIPPDQLRKL